MSEFPTFVLSAVPIEPTRFRNFFEQRSVRELLEHPGELRYAGFDLNTGEQARIVLDEMLEVGSPDWKRIQLYEDGTLVARVPGNEDFLAWASAKNRPFWEHPKLNPLALVEVVYSFVLLYGKLTKFLSPIPQKARCRAEFRHLSNGDARVYLTPYALESMAWEFERTKYFAQQDTMERDLDVDVAAASERPDRVAYLLVERIYTWFGVAPSEIPYLTGNDDERALDVDLIAKGGKRNA